ncbi:MAG: IPT/TIG domain-containing protein [Solirubrobacteraceae bacterium]
MNGARRNSTRPTGRQRARGLGAAAGGLLLAVLLPGCGAGHPSGAPESGRVSPSMGSSAGGTIVTVQGSSFHPGTTVYFGRTPARRVEVLSAERLLATAPPGAGRVAVSVDVSATASATTAAGTATPGTATATTTTTTTTTAAGSYEYVRPPSGAWLGLDGNSATYLGPVTTFLARHVVYDRSAGIEWTAGGRVREHGRLTPGGRALAFSVQEGMRPVVTIEYAHYTGHFESDPAFPSAEPGLAEYVRGFVSSAREIRADFPHAPIYFEPMNEPWGYTTPQYNGAQYAEVIAVLLPAVEAAGVPLDDVYVAATGRHWLAEMYQARPQLETEIGGWYAHPYGPPSGSYEEGTAGIQSLPQIRSQMRSGQNNVIVSEVGYCARDVNAGAECSGEGTTAAAGARMLTQMLRSALQYHREGWLRALLVYSRDAGGWAMQLAGGRLTPEGEALIAFANAHGG